ncbi:PREDICTED: LOW QUALITY PROTEIN: uncharacterized protein C9orf57 homolog [Lipotes vexillifer]|uniref:LOW QUALITY PROTEIN: uncharacterized protein C9orf57 homolog n=1 Tax=Lipotes vexillifer TaxID=118797 RepID=A0A340WZR6_LIPVE|nr:PREDICTED: LOW QUALITY PROTEIN: uncharacterized protein C9orf57 homolog [Lipotes vexillifer]
MSAVERSAESAAQGGRTGRRRGEDSLRLRAAAEPAPAPASSCPRFPARSPAPCRPRPGEGFNGGTCLSIHLLFWLEIRMRRTVFSGAFILFCLLGGGDHPVTKPEEGSQYPSDMEKGEPNTAKSDSSGEARYSGVGGVICRSCNLSIPFHGCLLDFGTCRTKPGQYCIKEVHIKGGIQWYSVQGCTESQDECFKRIVTTYEIHSTHCCHRPLCNF